MNLDSNATPSDLTEICSLFLTKAAAAYAEHEVIKDTSFSEFVDQLEHSESVSFDVFFFVMLLPREAELRFTLRDGIHLRGSDYDDYRGKLLRLLDVLEKSLQGSGCAASLLLIAREEFRDAESAASIAFARIGAHLHGELRGEAAFDDNRIRILSQRVQGFFQRVLPLLEDESEPD